MPGKKLEPRCVHPARQQNQSASHSRRNQSGIQNHLKQTQTRARNPVRPDIEAWVSGLAYNPESELVHREIQQQRGTRYLSEAVGRDWILLLSIPSLTLKELGRFQSSIQSVRLQPETDCRLTQILLVRPSLTSFARHFKPPFFSRPAGRRIAPALLSLTPDEYRRSGDSGGGSQIHSL
jgi:hypothetical protein